MPMADRREERSNRLLSNLADHSPITGHARGCMMVMAATTFRNERGFQAALARQRDEGKAMLRQRSSQGIKDGELPADADGGRACQLLFGVHRGMSMQAREGASRKDPARHGGDRDARWTESPKASGKAKACCRSSLAGRRLP
jgi:hypothetical protein